MTTSPSDLTKWYPWKKTCQAALDAEKDKKLRHKIKYVMDFLAHEDNTSQNTETNEISEGPAVHH